MARDLDVDHIYQSAGGKIPIKWTAPEGLKHRQYSSASDVWSYGMLLFEIWTLGRKPYEGTSTDEVCGCGLVCVGVVYFWGVAWYLWVWLAKLARLYVDACCGYYS